MRNILIALPVTGDHELIFLVCPANQLQVEYLGVALAGIEASLSQVPTSDPVALEQIDYVRTLLGKSVLVTGQHQKWKGRLQCRRHPRR